MNKIYLILVFCIGLISCSDKPIFEKELLFEDNIWSYEDKLILEFDITNVDQFYNLDLFLEHSPEFEYQNIYLNVETVFPNGEEYKKQVPIELANKRGKWNANCNSNNCKLKVFLRQNFKFKEPGKYIISIEQYSRENELTGLHSAKLALFHNKK